MHLPPWLTPKPRFGKPLSGFATVREVVQLSDDLWEVLISGNAPMQTDFTLKLCGGKRYTVGQHVTLIVREVH